jgi:predicted nucleic acid-binding protein
MTSSSSPPLNRGLDTVILVYSLLQGHPAAVPCEQYLRSHTDWFTSPLVLVEARNILTKVYAVDTGAATAKLQQFAAGPVAFVDLDSAGVTAAFRLADMHKLDLTDAVLLHLAQQHGANWLVTDDRRLAQICSQVGITAESPVDATLRQQVAVWETANLTSKGLPRILRRVHEWLNRSHLQAGIDFWSATSNGTHLP